MYDAHFHWSSMLGSERALPGIVNAASPEEYSFLKSRQEQYGYLISAGIHPWYADRYEFESFRPLLEQADFVGEIGLDNVWCETDPQIQRDRFLRQLRFASEEKKPVILHTKGREKEVYECIRSFPNRYLVHWYSCMDHLSLYMDLGCYFTVGVSVGRDPAVDRVVRCVPEDRLLLETDGVEAAAWAFGCPAETVNYQETLRHSLSEIARLRGDGKDAGQWERQTDKNFRRFTVPECE